MKHLSNNKGFTLIELMVVVVIVGILSAIAIPQYGRYTMRAHRTDAMGALQMILDAQERYYADHITYTTDLSDLGLTDPYITPQGRYSIKAFSCGGPLTQCVELIATALAGQAEDGNLHTNTMGRKDRIAGGVTHSW